MRLLDGWGNIQDMRDSAVEPPGKQLSLLSGHSLSSVALPLKNFIKLSSERVFLIFEMNVLLAVSGFLH